MSTTVSEESIGPLASLVEEITALAEHARLHGPAPDCAARMDAVMRKHRAQIEAAKRIESEAPREPSSVG